MNKTATRVTAAIFALATGVSLAQNVAILNGRGQHDNEYDQAIRDYGLDVTRVKHTKEAFKAFTDVIDQYDLVLATPLFNMAPGGKGFQFQPGDIETRAVKKWIEKGGVLVIPDGSYDNVREFLKWIDPSLGGLETGKCNSSQWAVLGHATHVEPSHPILTFPNYVRAANSWPHFEPVASDSKWRAIQNCSEGKPVTFVQNMGKGMVVISALRILSPHVENCYVASQANRAGIKPDTYTQSEIRIGDGSLTLGLKEDAPANSFIRLEVANDKGKTTEFATNLAERTTTLTYKIVDRGPVTTTLVVDTPVGGRRVLSKRITEIPQLLTIYPNAYRGILSTKRRCDTVDFKVRISPNDEPTSLAPMTYKVFDEPGNCVATVVTNAPEKVEYTEFWMPIPLDRDLVPGQYRIEATMQNGGKLNTRSSAEFEILAPRLAQCVVDEDNTLLVNGKPFFPLGIYHTAAEYEKVAEIGFNTAQFWKWNLNHDAYGSPRGLDRSYAQGLRAVFESNHSVVSLGKGLVDAYATHPGVLMWYTADEPAENCMSLEAVNDTWHYDKHHPTYIVSCREDLFGLHRKYGDVFAFDPYGDIDQAIRWFRTAAVALEGRQPIICVPWAAQKPEKIGLLRQIFYVALAHDARGVIWYCWKQAGGGPVGIGLHDNEASQKEIRQLIAEANEMLPGLVSTERRPFEEGAIHGMACGDKSGKRFLILINTTGGTVNADFAVPELAKVKSVFLPFAPKQEKKDKDGNKVLDKKGNLVMVETPIALADGRVQHAFKPYETLVYRW